MFQFVDPQKKSNNIEGQKSEALKKAWRGFKIAKRESDEIKMKEYARKIRNLQNDLGIKQTEFS